MGLLDRLFGGFKKTDGTSAAKPAPEGKKPVDAAAAVLAGQKASFDQKVQAKERDAAITQEALLKIFGEYFAPNKDFFSQPGSPKFVAYFGAVNAARDEMIRNPKLFAEATKWSMQALADLINQPKPGITNMLICGLIFAMGDYAVIKDAVYCVDFCEAIPNCIALYLLLTAQKLPQDRRAMMIDAGDNSDKTAFTSAMNALKVCDPSWRFTIV